MVYCDNTGKKGEHELDKILSGEKTMVIRPFQKQTNMDDWLIIEKLEDVLVGASIPYNYEQSRL